MLSTITDGLFNCICSYWAAFIILIIVLLVYQGIRENNVFKNKGVKSISARIPFIGHMFRVIMQYEHFKDFSAKMYNAFPDERYVGFRQFVMPIIMIRDLELIKQISIKDFDYFQDHVRTIDENTDPLFGNNLVALRGQKWRDMRATLSPAFTSSKMKGMFEFVVGCGEEMSQFFLDEMKKTTNKEKGYVEVELKDMFTRYTNDVIATSAFGIKINSLRDRDNEFYVMGKSATNFTGKQLLKFSALVLFPKFMKLLNVKLFQPEVSNFFRSLVSGTMKIREEQSIVRQDMINLLMEAKKGSLKHDSEKTVGNEAGFATVEESELGKEIVKRKWTDDEIIAQAVIFFIAGFDSSSNLLCFLGYELAVNPDIQKKLQNEIDAMAEKNNGKVDYNDLQHMKYMDMVVCETLRYWPPGIATDRKCVKDYILPPSNDTDGKSVKLAAGDGIFFPIYNIHHDPQYFENPEKFDPERFSDENKGSINPLAYIPFGMGPRNCIGSRFALMETKAVIFHLLKNFDLTVTSKTDIPVKLKKSAFNLQADKGLWVGLKPRK